MSTSIKIGTEAAYGSGSGNSNSSNKHNDLLRPVRVHWVLLNDKDKFKFEKYGGWNGLHTIEFSPVDIPYNQSTRINNKLLASAKPLIPNTSHPPTINEIVLIIPVPVQNSQSNSNIQDVEYFYLGPLNIWNNSNNNALPNQIETVPNKANYNLASKGINPNSDITKPNLGENFIDKAVDKIYMGEGDSGVLGRYGQGLIFRNSNGADIDENSPFKGKTGDSGFALVNGTKLDKNNKPIIEHPNTHSGLFSYGGQTVNVEVASKNMDSFNSDIKSENIVKKGKTETSPEKAHSDEKSELPKKVEKVENKSNETFDKDYGETIFVKDDELLDQNLDKVETFGKIEIAIPVYNINEFEKNFKFSRNYLTASQEVTTSGFSMPSGGKNLNSITNKISNETIPKEYRAILDTIAICEGTASKGDNGYNIFYGFSTFDINGPHPGTKFTDGDPHSAAGRYQFLIKTWKDLMPITAPMSKNNQDQAAYKKILQRLCPKTFNPDNENEIKNIFDRIKNPTWASFGFDKSGEFGSQVRYSYGDFLTIFRNNLKKYSV